MSLFGSSPEDSSLSKSAASPEPQSLFHHNQTPAAASHSSLFDDHNGNRETPWSMPTPKKSGKGDLVKSLLPASDVPESYIDAYDILLESGYREGAGSVSLLGAKEIFEGSGLSEKEQNRILDIVTGVQEPTGGLNRSQVNVLLALAGLSQQKEEATLDGVDERRKS